MTNESSNHPHGTFIFTISGVRRTINDPIEQGRQLLSSSGFDPADEYVLIRRLERETRSIGLDEDVDLREGGEAVFDAFRSDRIFRFMLNERGCEWGAATIGEPVLRAIGGIGEGEVLFLDRTDEADKELGPDDTVNLAERGTEHVRSEKRLVTVFFKNKPYELPRGVYTTEQLMAKFPIEPGYLLNLKAEDGELITLKPGERTRIKNGMHFYSQAPGGASS